jgi:hypothetical protein
MKIAFSHRMIILSLLLLSFKPDSHAQYKQFKLSPDGDTLNIIDKKGLKQGKWVNTVAALRGEPGYEEEGEYKNDKKEGEWRLYASSGDIVGVENYKWGGKDGLQQYYTYVGVLTREEQWRSINPDAPYDTIPMYGTDNNQITGYKIVRVEQYSVPDGIWKYYDDQTGAEIKEEKYERGRLVNDDGSTATLGTVPVKTPAVSDTTKKKAPVKTPEILEYEKKYSKKKRAQMERTGETGM